MSLTVDGVWKAGVWTSTVWVQNVWYEPVSVTYYGFWLINKRRRRI